IRSVIRIRLCNAKSKSALDAGAPACVAAATLVGSSPGGLQDGGAARALPRRGLCRARQLASAQGYRAAVCRREHRKTWREAGDYQAQTPVREGEDEPPDRGLDRRAAVARP